ncbi:gliding motility protein GldB-related protein [Mesonia aquimarina]|uniref:gliding motility protein GldB-related protein n=1 Tax=Mesonia aquimarina TaxID=1504967 RepID=UPI000EF55FF4|nr:hypothetical protein [Mesonia aquimarina]
MKRILAFLTFAILLGACQSQKQHSTIVTTDIQNFWKAYDKIRSTQDSILQYKYLDSLYFQKGTPGLAAIREARNYTPQDYISAINNYPKFWSSVKENTLKADQFSRELETGIEKLRVLYPTLKPAKIYFTIGALRTGGTTLDSLVLIGSEIAMADKNTISEEFPENIRNGRRTYFNSNPIDDIVLLNLHEYVHTQQNPQVHNLLSIAIREGVAEFVSSLAMKVASATPAITYGKENAEKVRAKFEAEMFYPNNQAKWFWSDYPNEFGVRDLGYYIGYQMAENYYQQEENKKEALTKMIELDFTNDAEIEEFVAKSAFFSAPLEELYQNFENKRPQVVGIKEFKNNSQHVDPTTKQITILFSAPLNGHNTGIDFGDLGPEAFPKNDINGRFWSADHKAWTISVDLEPNKRYQLLVSNNFRTKNDIPLQAYLIDFKTANN